MNSGYERCKRVIALILIFGMLLPAFVLTTFAEAGKVDKNGFDPKTNTTFEVDGIVFHIPDYFTKGEGEKATYFYASGEYYTEARMAFACLPPHGDMEIYEYVKEAFASLRFDAAHIRIGGMDGILAVTDRPIYAGFEGAYVFLFPENAEHTVMFSFAQKEEECSTDYSPDFARILWTVNDVETGGGGYRPYPIEDCGSFMLYKIGKLPQEAYQGKDMEQVCKNRLFYAEGTVVSVGDWSATCDAIGNGAPESDRNGIFITVENQDGIAWFVVPRYAKVALPAVGENVRFYGQYVEFNEETQTVGLNSYPAYEDVPIGN